MHWLLRSALLAAVCLTAGPALAKTIVNVSWQPFAAFQRSEPTKTRFGAFSFVQGGILRGDDRSFGAWSGLHVGDGGSSLIAVSDKGVWWQAKIERDAAGDIQGLTASQTAPLLNEDGQAERAKFNKDAEGLAIVGGRALVSFERLDVVRSYQWSGADFSGEGVRLDFPFPKTELRQNEGLEALAVARSGSPLGANTPVAISEGSINMVGDLYAFVLSGPRRGTFFVKRTDRFNVTGADFLPNGDLLVLERRFTYRDGLSMRIRMISADDIRPGATVNGPELLNANLDYTIDNMEGLSVWQNAAGETMVSLISDDNQSFLQSTVYLEFRYEGLGVLPEPSPKSAN